MAKSKNTLEFTSEEGNKYTFQKVAPVEWLDIMDEVEDGERKGQRRRLYGLTLENVVVAPKKQMSEFDTFAELDEVVAAALRFQQGK